MLKGTGISDGIGLEKELEEERNQRKMVEKQKKEPRNILQFPIQANTN